MKIWGREEREKIKCSDAQLRTFKHLVLFGLSPEMIEACRSLHLDRRFDLAELLQMALMVFLLPLGAEKFTSLRLCPIHFNFSLNFLK